MVDVVKGNFTHAPKGNKLLILIGVTAALTISALPFLNKKVMATEQKMAQLRDGQYDVAEAKNEARNQRLQGPRRDAKSA